MTTNAREKALPFEPLIPNETTIAAMREARTGNLKSFDGVAALMADLHAEGCPDLLASTEAICTGWR
jgi:DNA-damage-inducible protein J